MLKQLLIALRLTAISVVALGLLYPLVVTGIAHVAFSQVAADANIGQAFSKPEYFWGRPSAAGKGYDPTNTSGTNLGATSKKLIDTTRATIATLEKANPGMGAPPMDLITSSASGIDPDISPAAAYYQATRVARARKLAVATVNAIIAAQVRGRTFGMLGEPRVSVLALNLALNAAR